MMSGSRIRIGAVWDSTLDAARGRAGVIAPLALGALFVPGAVLNAVALFGGAGAAVPYALGTLAATALVIWGLLAIVAVVTDPATTRADAVAQANRRFGPALANGLLLGIIILALLSPAVIALLSAGIDWAALQGPRPDVRRALAGASPGAIRFASLYGLLFVGLWLWLMGRTALTYPVALNERRGLGAVGRSFQLTRGAGARLTAMFFLFLVVLRLLTAAVQGVVAVPVRLMLGAGSEAWALFAGGLAAGLVSTALVALFCVFTGRLYVAAAEVRG